MANEITFGWKTGKNLTFGVYTSAGVEREVGTAMTETPAASGLYLGTPTAIVSGDFVIVSDSDASKVIGQGPYQPEVSLKDDAITSAKYDESTAFPVKSADAGSTQIARTGADADTLETISDEIAALEDFDPDNDAVANVTLVDTTTTNTDMRGTDGANTTKTGFSLASDGLDSVSIVEPSGVASNFREMVVQTWRRFFKRSKMTANSVVTYKDDNTTVATTQTLAETDDDQIMGAST